MVFERNKIIIFLTLISILHINANSADDILVLRPPGYPIAICNDDGWVQAEQLGEKYVNTQGPWVVKNEDVRIRDSKSTLPLDIYPRDFIDTMFCPELYAGATFDEKKFTSGNTNNDFQGYSFQLGLVNDGSAQSLKLNDEQILNQLVSYWSNNANMSLLKQTACSDYRKKRLSGKALWSNWINPAENQKTDGIVPIMTKSRFEKANWLDKVDVFWDVNPNDLAQNNSIFSPVVASGVKRAIFAHMIPPRATIDNIPEENYVGWIELPQLLKTSNSAAGLCYMMAKNVKSKSWIEKINNQLTSQRFDPHYIQDFIDYLALSKLKTESNSFLKKIQDLPESDRMNTQLLSKSMLDNEKEKHAFEEMDDAFFDQYLLNAKPKYTDSFAVTERMKEFCSSLESKYCAVRNLNISEILLSFSSLLSSGLAQYYPSIPNDLMASSIYSSNVYLTQYETRNAHKAVFNMLGTATLAMQPKDKLFVKNSDGSWQINDNSWEHLATKYRLTSALSVSQEILQDGYLNRVPEVVNDRINTGSSPKGSQLSVLKSEAQRRITSLNWYKEFNQLGSDAALRDIVFMMAYQVIQKHSLNKQLEQIQAAEGATLSVLFDKTHATAERVRQRTRHYE